MDLGRDRSERERLVEVFPQIGGCLLDGAVAAAGAAFIGQMLGGLLEHFAAGSQGMGRLLVDPYDLQQFAKPAHRAVRRGLGILAQGQNAQTFFAYALKQTFFHHAGQTAQKGARLFGHRARYHRQNGIVVDGLRVIESICRRVVGAAYRLVQGLFAGAGQAQPHARLDV